MQQQPKPKKNENENGSNWQYKLNWKFETEGKYGWRHIHMNTLLPRAQPSLGPLCR